MGMLVDGRWTEDEAVRTSKSGAFEREVSSCRSWIGKDDRYPAESGRYHLFVKCGLPLGLSGDSLPIAERARRGRQRFLHGARRRTRGAGPSASTRNRSGGAPHASRLQRGRRRVHGALHGAGSVGPYLGHDREQRIGRHHPHVRFSFSRRCPASAPNASIAPKHAAAIDALNVRIYEAINNGVYRCGFAASQVAYDEAFEVLFSALDEMDARLAGRATSVAT